MNENKILSIEDRVLTWAKAHAKSAVPAGMQEADMAPEELKTIHEGVAQDFAEGAFQVLAEIRIELGLKKVDYESKYYGV